MRILRLDIHHFRGISGFTLCPRGHVLLVGEPGSGRSTVLEALHRVLSPDSTRLPLVDDFDFSGRDTKGDISVEVVIGQLGRALEQDFFDHLEVWDDEAEAVVTHAAEPRSLDEKTQFVLRLCCQQRLNFDPLTTVGI